MSEGRKIVKNAAFLGGTNLVNLGAALIFTAMSTRYLGKAGYGQMGIVFSLMSFFEAIVRGGISTVLTQRVAEDRGAASLYWWPSLLMSLFFGVFFVAGGMIGAWFLDGDMLVVTAALIASVISACRLLADNAVGILRGMDRMGPEFATTLLERALFILLFYGVLTTFQDTNANMQYSVIGFLAIFAVNTVSQVVQTAALLIPLWRELLPSFALNRSALRELYAASHPLWWCGLLIALHWRLETFLFPRISTDLELGTFLAAFKFPDMIRIVPWLLGMAIFPLLNRQAKGSNDHFQITYGFALKLLLLLSIPCMAGFILAAPFLVGTLLAEEFKDAIVPLIWMSLSIPPMFMNGLFNYGALTLGKKHLIVKALTFTLLLQAGAGLILIPQYGAIGGAYSFLFSEIAMLSYTLTATTREIAPLPFRDFKGATLCLAAVGVALLYLRHTPILLSSVLITVIFIAGVAAFRAFSRQEIQRMTGLIRRKPEPRESVPVG